MRSALSVATRALLASGGAQPAASRDAASCTRRVRVAQRQPPPPALMIAWATGRASRTMAWIGGRAGEMVAGTRLSGFEGVKALPAESLKEV